MKAKVIRLVRLLFVISIAAMVISSVIFLGSAIVAVDLGDCVVLGFKSGEVAARSALVMLIMVLVTTVLGVIATRD